MTDKSIPQGRFARLGRLAALGARTGASLLASKDGSGAAQAAAHVLGNMRGLAAKVGQMASYVDGFVPEEHRHAYETSLSKLRNAAPTSSYASIAETIEEDLGQPISKLYVAFEETPFASASIGQVHRATLEDGRRVAVKVQHPGIHAAVESDLSNASLLEGFARVGGGGKLGSKNILAVLKERFREELDYGLEAERQERFRRFHADDPAIHIPSVVRSHSGPRVITSELAEGKTLDEVALESEEKRRFYAETMWRFVFRGNLVLGMFNADPHPGNYLFRDDAITFLDFGCCQPIEDVHRRAAAEVHLAAMRRDEARFREGVIALIGTRPGKYREFTVAYSRRCFAPLFESPFEITREFTAHLVSSVREMKSMLFDKEANFTPMPSNMVLMNRLQFGFYSVLARLAVEVDYHAAERAFLETSEFAADLV